MFTGTSLFKNNIYYNIIYVFSRRVVECNIIKEDDSTFMSVHCSIVQIALKNLELYFKQKSINSQSISYESLYK